MMALIWLHRTWRAGIAGLLLVALLAGCSSIGKQTKSPPGYHPQSSRDSKKGSIFGSLFQSEPDPPKTVNEFLKQPRVDP